MTTRCFGDENLDSDLDESSIMDALSDVFRINQLVTLEPLFEEPTDLTHPKEFKKLVLSRKESEKINIGNGIVITVTRIKGNSVLLGIEAPEDVPIRRGELPCLFPEEFFIASPGLNAFAPVDPR